MGVPTALLLIDACQSCPEVTWSRVRGLFVFAAARGDLRPEPGLGHCFLGPAAPLVSAVLGCRPFPSCSGLSDGGECGESGGGYPGASSSSGSSWKLCWKGWKPKGYGGGWQPRSPGVTEMGLRLEQAWEHEDLHLDMEHWMVPPSFLLDPRISDQIFSSSTLLRQDSCSASPGYDTLGFVLKARTSSMVGASPM